MGVLKVLGLLVAVLAIYIGYVVYTSELPEYMSDREDGKAYTIAKRLSEPILNLLSKAGILRKVDATRYLSNLAFSAQMKHMDSVKVTVDSFDGVPVRIFDPVERKPGGPAVVYFHGGGWVFLHPAEYHNPTQTIADETKFLVVSVDYRLAPEHKYPAAVDDCQKATEYLIKHASKYNIDPKRIAVMGDSAGGNLAATVSLSMKKAATRPKLQVAIYPGLQGMDFTLPSYQNDSKIVETTDDILFFMLAYLLGKDMHEIDDNIKDMAKTNRLISHSVWKEHGHKLSHKLLPKDNFHKDYKPVPSPEGNVGYSKELDRVVTEPRFSPLMADDLKNLPEAFIMTCQYDVLRDDSFLYAARLKKAGVKVTHHHDMRCYHGAMTYIERHPLFIKTAKFVAQNL